MEEMGQEGDCENINVSLKNSIRLGQKATLPLKSINFVNMKHQANHGSPEPPSNLRPNPNQNVKILNANLVNLNPNSKF